MWKFVDEKCPSCNIDLTTVGPKRVRWLEYGECPNCSHLCPVIEVEPAPEPTPEPAPEPAPEPEPEPEE